MQILGCLQLDDDEAALTRHTEEINHSSLACRQRRNLRIKMPRVETRIQSRGVCANDRFQPAFGRAAIEQVVSVRRERAALQRELAQKCF